MNPQCLLKKTVNVSSVFQLLRFMGHPANKNATLTDTPLPLSGVVELLPQDQEVDDVGHVVVSASGSDTLT